MEEWKEEWETCGKNEARDELGGRKTLGKEL